MKKIITFIIIVSMILSGTLSYTVSAESWIKYTMSDGSFSFHYPLGWRVDEAESAVVISNAKTDEQLIMTAIPYSKVKTPTNLAKDFIILLNNDNPELKASNWLKTPQNNNSQITFDLTNEIDKKLYKGTGLVIKDDQEAFWFSYITLSPTYSRDRGLGLLQGFMASIASGSDSNNPMVAYDHSSTAKIETNAKGFIFVLEFALGSPLTTIQERIILDELKSSWRLYTEEELSEYDSYDFLAKNILIMDQEMLNEIKTDLELTIKEWIEESPDTDEIAKIIREQLNTASKVIISGESPLTEVSLTAYSEIIAYSRLLKENPKAMPEQISLDSVNEIKKQVKDSWKDFTSKEKEQITSSPGLWISLRALVNNGSTDEQDTVRSSLVKLTPDRPSNASNDQDDTLYTENDKTNNTSSKPMDMVSHNVLMNMQQMTFNSYMWSRGFNYSINYGRM